MLVILLTLDPISLISQLDKERKELVLSDTTNPFPKDWFAAPISATPATAKSTSNSKPSIKDTIAQQRRQKNAALSRPGSAAETATPARDVSARIPARYVNITSLRYPSTRLQ